jgi:hypothetical protein
MDDKILKRKNNIMGWIVFIIICLYVFLCGVALCSCAVKPLKGECPECFYYRVCADSKGAANCGKEFDACMKVLRAERCKEDCREPVSVYRDFNDCMKTLD